MKKSVPIRIEANPTAELDLFHICLMQVEVTHDTAVE